MSSVTVCVWQNLHLSQWRKILQLLAASSFYDIITSSCLLLGQNGLYITRNHLLLTPLCLHGLHRLCPEAHVITLVIWFRFITQWIGDHLCAYFISAEIQCPSSLFPFPLSFLFFSPFVFTNSFSLLLHICLQLMHTVRFSSNWHLFYRV